jgi:phosphoribosylformylglycinamidine cyclo-ligase
VDIDAGDEAVRRLIQQHIRRTHGPRVIDNPGGFAGLLRLDFNEQLFRRNYRDPVLVACTDGVGSKVLLAQKLGVHDTVGIDCVAMNVNDLVVQGAEPLLFLDYIGVHEVEPAAIERLVAGVAAGCEIAGCALVGGETAELPDLQAGRLRPRGLQRWAWSSSAGRWTRPRRAGRRGAGARVRRGAQQRVHAGAQDHRARGAQPEGGYPDLDPDRTLGEVLLTPTRIYAQPIVKLRSGRTRSRRWSPGWRTSPAAGSRATWCARCTARWTR